ncbi:hypothetical protein C0Q70_13074 [Pomacea canaliculata]|uniref:Uncharacterized protein n=1 Tax=Pomacea canaliculata TaxID=400727 RepID=A0A2T7NW64_POMCA|nr:hypothetical protein C0Q70_13074 [Pomacea canaliculata]
MTPDRDFLVDTCSQFGFPEVIVCCGAGHAYNELAVEGATAYDISQFTIRRPALTDPTFQPVFYMGLKKADVQARL